jgi:hypothetical protein
MVEVWLTTGTRYSADIGTEQGKRDDPEHLARRPVLSIFKKIGFAQLPKRITALR